MITYLDQENVYAGDAVSIVGAEKSKIIDLVRSDFCEIYGTDEEANIIDWLTSDGSVERGTKGSKHAISFVNSAQVEQDLMERFSCSSVEESIVFTIFHATGHNAQMGHSRGYMDRGNCIPWYLGEFQSGTNNACASFPNSLERIVESLSELIIDDWSAEWIKQIHRKRFE